MGGGVQYEIDRCVPGREGGGGGDTSYYQAKPASVRMHFDSWKAVIRVPSAGSRRKSVPFSLARLFSHNLRLKLIKARASSRPPTIGHGSSMIFQAGTVSPVCNNRRGFQPPTCVRLEVVLSFILHFLSTVGRIYKACCLWAAWLEARAKGDALTETAVSVGLVSLPRPTGWCY